MTIVARIPRSYIPEREYVLRVVCERFLGQSLECRSEDRSNTSLRLAGAADGEILLEDGLFSVAEADWLRATSLPCEPLEYLDAPVEIEARIGGARLPVIYGARLESGQFIERAPGSRRFGIDLLGGAFFLLTRYEELASPEHDRHERFPGAASLLAREGLLDRAVVNEYVELLWEALTSCWPSLERPIRAYRVLPTHDVDRPFCVYRRPLRQVIRQAAGDLLRRRDLELLWRRLRSVRRVKQNGPSADPCSTFDWIMEQSEKRGLRSAFYFLHHTGRAIDSDYLFDDAAVVSLMQDAHSRGHEIGLHPSYHSFRAPPTVADEFARLLVATKSAGIEQREWGGRQHYLRWDVSATWEAWDAAGLTYDSTVGFADVPGFRCGTCWEYPVFSLRSRRMLALLERPLIVMEETLLSESYAGLTDAEALATIRKLARQCQRHKGDFVLLWHNSRLLSRREKALYSAALDIALNPIDDGRTGE